MTEPPQRLSMRLTEQTKFAIDVARRELGMTQHEFVRRAISHQMERLKRDDPESFAKAAERVSAEWRAKGWKTPP